VCIDPHFALKNRGAHLFLAVNSLQPIVARVWSSEKTSFGLQPKTIMSILFTCSCGKRLKVADQFGGKRCKCPGCGEIRAVPEQGAEDEGTKRSDESAVDAGMARRARSGIRAQQREDIPEVLPADDSNEATYEPGPDDEAPRRKKKRSRKKTPRKKGFFSGFDFGFERSLANKGAVAGVLMMVIAVVWFVCGLMFLNRIFFYPPILFIIGLIALIKGLVS
jgi:hypothetical protein